MGFNILQLIMQAAFCEKQYNIAMKKFFNTLKNIGITIIGVIIILLIITYRVSNETQFYRRIFGKSDIIKQTELVGVWFIEKTHVEMYEYGDLSYSNTLEDTGETIYYKDGTGVTINYADKDTLSFNWSLQGNELGTREMTNGNSFTHYREVTRFENDQLFLRGIMDRDESSEILIENVLRKAE